MRTTVDKDQVHLASDCPIWNLYMNISGETEQPECNLLPHDVKGNKKVLGSEKKHLIALFGELAFEEIMDLTH
jgi:hypothetical protein